MNNSLNNRGYTPAQVANLLGYKVSTVYAMISRHEIHAHKIGRRREITDLAIREFLQSRRSNAGIIDYTKGK